MKRKQSEILTDYLDLTISYEEACVELGIEGGFFTLGDYDDPIYCTIDQLLNLCDQFIAGNIEYEEVQEWAYNVGCNFGIFNWDQMTDLQKSIFSHLIFALDDGWSNLYRDKCMEVIKGYAKNLRILNDTVSVLH